MSNVHLRISSYRRHKPTGQAVVTLGGRDIYLGNCNSVPSRSEYNRLTAEWLANDGQMLHQEDLTVVEVAAAFMKHARGYYRGPDGRPTTEVAKLQAHHGPADKALWSHIGKRHRAASSQ